MMVKDMMAEDTKNAHQASRYGLSADMVKQLHSVLHPFAEKITSVGIFGSRATKQYSEMSDVDLILYGDLSAAEGALLGTLFDELSLCVKVDVYCAAHIAHAGFKAQIDAHKRLLFSQQDLRKQP
jgi:predicted nucleotidyltransferase